MPPNLFPGMPQVRVPGPQVNPAGPMSTPNMQAGRVAGPGAQPNGQQAQRSMTRQQAEQMQAKASGGTAGPVLGCGAGPCQHTLKDIAPATLPTWAKILMAMGALAGLLAILNAFSKKS